MMTTEQGEKYTHLREQSRKLADADDSVRIRSIQTGYWVPYENATLILEQMEDMFTHAPVDRMPNMLLVGPSNNGKTRLLKRFLDSHPTDPNPSGDAMIVPALLVAAPPSPDIDELCRRILEELNAPYREKAKPGERMGTVKKLLKQTATRMLLIDEIQHMLTGGAVKQREFRNAIKDLGNSLQISIVAAGVEEAYTVFATDSQLSNRFHTESLPLWRLDADLAKLLISFERRLPLRCPSNLKSPELVHKLFQMSEGIIGEIYAVLEKASIKAIRTGAECISLKLLDDLRWTKPSARKEHARFA